MDRRRPAQGGARRPIAVLSLALLSAFAVGLLAPGGARAEGECPLYFPDFSCDREVRHENSVRPMTMPYLFEDPFIATEAQFVGIWHEFGRRSVFEDGELGVLALQLRLAITERLAFIATKDGFAFFRPETKLGGTRVLNDDEGFTDITIGFKYALIDWRDKNFIFTPALRYEIPLGNSSLFQGNGDGVIIPSGTAAWTSDEGDIHVIAGMGAQVAIDSKKNSSSLFYNLHMNYAYETDGIPLLRALVPFLEFSGMTWTGNGRGGNNFSTRLGNLDLNTIQAATGTGPFEGADFANLGSRDIAGKTIVNIGIGMRMPLEHGVSLGMVYERPITERTDIFKQRFTFMTTYEF